MKQILKELNQRPIAYYPVYRKLTGSTTAGILLSQLMYWFNKKDKFHKTNDELMDETMLTKDELKSAKNKIKKLPFIDVKLEGLPAKTYYVIDWDLYLSSMSESLQPDGGNPTNTEVEITPTFYIDTKTTTKTTTEKKKNILLPDELNIEAFKQWEIYKGKSYSRQGKTLSINKLIKYPKNIQMQMVENSIINNYAGLFEIKQQGNNQNNFNGSYLENEINANNQNNTPPSYLSGLGGMYA